MEVILPILRLHIEWVVRFGNGRQHAIASNAARLRIAVLIGKTGAQPGIRGLKYHSTETAPRIVLRIVRRHGRVVVVRHILRPLRNPPGLSPRIVVHLCQPLVPVVGVRGLLV